MREQDEILSLLTDALNESPYGSECDLLYVGQQKSLTRFTQSAIHQNLVVDDARVVARVMLDGGVGVAATNEIIPETLSAAILKATEIARQQTQPEKLPSLPTPSPIGVINTFDEQTASFSPSDRAASLIRLFNHAGNYRLTLSGAFTTEAGAVALVNSSGINLYQPVTSADLNLLAFSHNGSGYASGVGRSVSDFVPMELAEKAVEKCLQGTDPKDIEPGEYDVLLEPQAVGDLLEWTSQIGFSARECQEGTSFMTGKLGERIAGDNVTIVDDAMDPRGLPFPFDLEGAPKQRVFLIDRGVAAGVVHDRQSAEREGVHSTGHSLGAEFPNRPLALNLIFETGTSTYQEMLAQLDRGLVITRFHYINGYLDTRNALLTGMTRDGTFWVERGLVKHGVKNLRFADSMLRVLSNIAAVSSTTKAVSIGDDLLGACVCPAILVKGFKFTSGTDH